MLSGKWPLAHNMIRRTSFGKSHERLQELMEVERKKKVPVRMEERGSKWKYVVGNDGSSKLRKCVFMWFEAPERGNEDGNQEDV